MPQSGSKMVGPCPYCGQRYRLTNFMRRTGLKDDQGRRLSDTHLIACWNRVSRAKQTEG